MVFVSRQRTRFFWSGSKKRNHMAERMELSSASSYQVAIVEGTANWARLQFNVKDDEVADVTSEPVLEIILNIFSRSSFAENYHLKQFVKRPTIAIGWQNWKKSQRRAKANEALSHPPEKCIGGEITIVKWQFALIRLPPDTLHKIAFSSLLFPLSLRHDESSSKKIRRNGFVLSHSPIFKSNLHANRYMR